MAIQTILNGVNVISIDDTKYKINTYSEQTGWLEVVNITNPASPFPVARLYAGITHFLVTPTGAKFNKTKASGVDITLD